MNSSSTGFVDVLIHSTAIDQVALANYTFKLTPISVAPAPGFLEFQTIQSDSEQSVIAPHPYIFAGLTSSINFAANVDPGNLQMTGFDFTTTFSDVTVGTTSLLLTRLDLQHIGPGLFGSFKLELVQNPGQTFFLDQSFSDVAIDPTSYSHFGTITIPFVAVPEPATMTTSFIAFALIGMAFRKSNRSKRKYLRCAFRPQIVLVLNEMVLVLVLELSASITSTSTAYG